MPEQPSQPAALRESLSTSSERIELIIEAAEKAAAGIIEDAEAQARTYLEQSRQRADQIANERAAGLSELADSLMTRAESVKRQSADLIEALEAARAQIAERLAVDVEIPSIDESAPPVSAPPTQPESHLAPVAEPPTEAAPEVPEAPVAEPPSAEPEAEPEPEPEPAEEAPTTSVPPPPPPPEPKQPARAATPASAGARLLATQMAVAGSSREEIASRLENEFGIADPGALLDGILGPQG